MGPLVRALVEENDHEVTVQVVFRRNDNGMRSISDRLPLFRAGFDFDGTSPLVPDLCRSS